MHTLIVGATCTGKTSLAKSLAARFRNSHDVLVYDPLAVDNRDWYGAAVYNDWEEFQRRYWSSKRGVAIFDESAQVATRKTNDGLTRTALQGRHRGFLNVYIVQSYRRLPLALRGQCTHIYAFTLSKKESEILAEECVDLNFQKCYALEKGQYVVKHGRDRSIIKRLF